MSDEQTDDAKKLRDLRDIANRLQLGDAASRWLRGLLCEMIGILIGEPENHPDIDGSGHRFPPQPLGARISTTYPVAPASIVPAGRLAAPAPPHGQPVANQIGGGLSIAEAFEKSRAAKAAAEIVAATPKAAPPPKNGSGNGAPAVNGSVGRITGKVTVVSPPRVPSPLAAPLPPVLPISMPAPPSPDDREFEQRLVALASEDEKDDETEPA